MGIDSNDSLRPLSLDRHQTKTHPLGATLSIGGTPHLFNLLSIAAVGNMYKLLRNSHLLLGLFFSSFVLMFGASSLRFAHPEWISVEPTTTSTVSLQIETVSSPRSLARSVMEEQGLRGNFVNLKETDDGYSFEIRRMGTTHLVRYFEKVNRVEIETLDRPFMSVLLGMHFTFGFGHEDWLYDLLGVFNLLVSLALLLLGATGIYLWSRLHKERLTGSVILVTSILSLGGLIIAIRVA